MASYCDVCNICIPSETAFQEHIKGKKHCRILLLQKSRQELANRSVFLYGFPAKSFTERELTEFFAKNFHDSARIIQETGRGHAILEFHNPSAAANVLKQKKYSINGKPALTKPREVAFEHAERSVEQDFDADTNEEIVAHLKLIPFSGEKYAYILQALDLIDGEKRLEIAKSMENGLRKSISGDFSIEIFGSSANGLGLRGCDLDLALLFKKESSFDLLRSKAFLLAEDPDTFSDDNRILPAEILSLGSQERARLICRLLNFQRKNFGLPIQGLTPIVPVRCPVTRFLWNHKISVDLSVDNTLGVNNSKWLANMAEKEPRFRQLVFLLRYWAKLNGIVSSEQHSMTSYALTLMVVTFLQQESVLPIVNSGSVQKFDSIDLDFVTDWDPTNTESSTDDLLRKFFVFFAKFSFKNTVICPRSGEFLRLDNFFVSFESDVPGVPKHFRKTIVNIQDPFVLTHNTAANVATKVVQKLREQLSTSVHRMKVGKCETAIGAVLDADGKSENGNGNGECSSGRSSVVSGDRPGSRGESDFLIKPSNPAVQTSENWPAAAMSAMRSVLQDILQFEVQEHSSSQDEPPPNKRPRFLESEKIFQCKALWKSWKGRRLKRRAVARDFPDISELEMEHKTTDLLKMERKVEAELNIALDFDVRVKSVMDDGKIGIEVSLVHVETNQDFNTLCHFLKPFMTKLVSVVC